MNPNMWLTAGLILMFAELIIPGGVVVFLGVGGLVVALAISFGLVSGWVSVMTLYFVSTITLLLGLRSVLMRFVGGDYSKSNTLEVLDAFGERVEVIETIGPGEKPGRISFRETQWPALSDGAEISAGSYAKIIAQENVFYIVSKE